MTIRQRQATLVFSVLGILALATPAALAQFSIVIRPNATLASNGAALASFNRAANQWAARITDPATIYIDAGLAALDPGVLGETDAAFLPLQNFDTVRNSMVADSAGEADDGIVAFLPTDATFTADLPPGFTLATSAGNKQLLVTRANGKALDLINARSTISDGTITFSTNFRFDYGDENGAPTDSTAYDFESIAAHEIGHLLGFISSVDSVDFLLANNRTGAIAPTTLDLFRFQNGTDEDPSSAAEFTTAERSLLTGGDAITDDIMSEYRMSTGQLTANRPSGDPLRGDGRQASHWKDNDLTGTTIGVMDPTFGTGQIIRVGNADFRALDLIGYDVVVTPEPASLAFTLPLLGGIQVVRSRRAKRRITAQK